MPRYIVGSQSDLPQSVLEYLANGVREGERNNKLFAAALQCYYHKLGQDVAEIKLLDRARADGLSESETRKTIANAYKYGADFHGAAASAAPPPSSSTPSSSNGQWPDPIALPTPDPGLDLAGMMAALFRPDEGISIGVGSRKPDGELVLDGGVVRPWKKWETAKRPLSAWNKGGGLFFRVNPMRQGGKKDADIIALRHALIEFDLDEKGDPILKEVQFALILKFNLPVVSLVDSGGKSLHAIIHIDAADRKQFDERLAAIFSLFPEHSVDRQNKNPSRYSRLPGFARENGKEPRLLAVNIGPADFATWEKQRQQSAGLVQGCVSGAAFLNLVIPPKAIIIDDWLKEGEVGYIYAFRGVGKTWMVLYFCTSLATGQNFGPWKTIAPCPVMYIDGEMSYHDDTERLLGLIGHIPENLSILNHEVLFHANSGIMNFADRAQQKELLQLALDRGKKVIVLDNISCLFSGVDEDRSREWEGVKSWLLELRRHRISPVLVHHSGYNLSHMRGTSSREDAASWVMRLDSKKEDFETMGAKFISRFTKYRGRGKALDYEWTFEPDPANPNRINIYHVIANRAEVLLQWVRDGLTECGKIAKEMGISEGWASKLATQWIKAGKLRKKGREYELV